MYVSLYIIMHVVVQAQGGGGAGCFLGGGHSDIFFSDFNFLFSSWGRSFFIMDMTDH